MTAYHIGSLIEEQREVIYMYHIMYHVIMLAIQTLLKPPIRTLRIKGNLSSKGIHDEGHS